MDEELKKFVLKQLEQHQEYIEALHKRLQFAEDKLYDAHRALEFIQRSNGK